MVASWSRAKKARYLVIAAFGLTAAAAAAVVLILMWDIWKPTGGQSAQTFSINANLSSREVIVDGTATLQIDVKNTLKQSFENIAIQVLAQNGEFVTGGDSAVSKLDSGEIDSGLGNAWSGAPAVIWRLGQLSAGESRATTVSFKATGGPGEKVVLKVLAYSAAETWQNCGFLRLMHCNVDIKNSLLAQKDIEATIVPVAEAKTTLSLGRGYNLVALPQVMSADSLNDFWSQFTTPLGLYLGSDQNWINVADSVNWSNIKPGNAIWLYHPDGGEVKLPAGDVTDISSTVEIQLHSGWNQVGNPYDKRIQWQGDQILLQTATESMSLNSALERGLITSVLGVAGAVENVDGFANPMYLEMVQGRFWPAYSGLFVAASENAKLILPGKMIVAPGETLSTAEKAKILGWINRNSLDVCGNKPSNAASGNPLLNVSTGEILDQFDCVLINHSDRPWNVP